MLINKATLINLVKPTKKYTIKVKVNRKQEHFSLKFNTDKIEQGETLTVINSKIHQQVLTV